ncbi:MAG: hypothetical protein JOY91_10125, partial [Sinobacteraceae bacterium]|nr:hypothetical protein [Nevskiaceae bacterium]
MSSLPPEKPAEFTASDILSADAWSGRNPRPALGIDVACTKIAVDFQNMRKEQIEETVRRNLELLREATSTDCAFLLVLRTDETFVEEVQLARSAFAQCRPEGMRELSLEDFPWLKGRLEHLRLSELRDTSSPRREQGTEARKLADLQIGSALLISLRVQGKPAAVL